MVYAAVSLLKELAHMLETNRQTMSEFMRRRKSLWMAIRPTVDEDVYARTDESKSIIATVSRLFPMRNSAARI